MRNAYKTAFVLTLLLLQTVCFAKTATSYRAACATAVMCPQEGKGSSLTEKELLGPYNNIKSLTASNISHAYMTFMENVRALKTNWTAEDWRKAQEVMDQLQTKKNAMNRMLGVSDKAKINKLQSEFKAMHRQSIAAR